jgi:putative membrane protein
MWRLAAWIAGVFILCIALGSPLAAMDHHLLTAHMAQHLLLMTVAAPLILLGVLNRRRVFHGIVIHPALCWLAGTATVIAWHIPSLFELGMRSPQWHGLEQATFLAAGLLFWWPVIQPGPSLVRLPRWGVPLYLFLATLPCDALSAYLTFCDRVVYTHYLSGHPLFTPYRVFDISPLADQEYAGALMWVWVTFAYLAPAVWITIQMLSPQRRALNANVV